MPNWKIKEKKLSIKQIVPDGFINLIWCLAGIFGSGAVWYFLSQNDMRSVVWSVFAAAAFAFIALYLHRLNNPATRYRAIREKLATFMQEGNDLLVRENESPLPLLEHNEWVERVEQGLTSDLDKSYAVRLSNFNGMTFYGDGSEKSKFRNSVDGRLRRLNEFLTELN